MSKAELPRIYVVVLAAGSGERMGRSRKQFLTINGRPILSYSFEVFVQCPFVSRIIVVAPRGKISHVKHLLGRKSRGRVDVIAGGDTRRASSYNALKFIRQKRRGCDYVVFHDGVRPLLSAEMIEAVVEEAKSHGAAVLASQALNVIAEVQGGEIRRAHNAHAVYNTQTPHCYRFDWILQAHESGINKKKGREAYENIELVAGIGKKIRVVDRFYRNMKLTFPQDIIAIKALLKHSRSNDFFRLEGPRE